MSVFDWERLRQRQTELARVEEEGGVTGYLIVAAVVIVILLLAVIAFSALGIALAALAREQRERGKIDELDEKWPDEIG